MIVNVDRPSLKLVLESAETDYKVIEQTMERKGISNSESKESLRNLMSSLGMLRYYIGSNMTYIGELPELLEKISKQRIELHIIIGESETARHEVLKLKVCPNGHCYKHSGDYCSFCGYGISSRGRDTYVGRIEKNVPIFNKVLYIGQKEGNYVLTDDENSANKVSEIEVGFNPDYKCQGLNINYKFYYKISVKDFNIVQKKENRFEKEHTEQLKKDTRLSEILGLDDDKLLYKYGWEINYFDEIQIGKITIKGGELVKMCDKIVDNKQKEVVIEYKQ